MGGNYSPPIFSGCDFNAFSQSQRQHVVRLMCHKTGVHQAFIVQNDRKLLRGFCVQFKLESYIVN